jgi:hypothetical protein
MIAENSRNKEKEANKNALGHQPSMINERLFLLGDESECMMMNQS